MKYKVLSMHTKADASIEDQINALANDGWRVRAASWQHSELVDVIFEWGQAPQPERKPDEPARPEVDPLEAGNA